MNRRGFLLGLGALAAPAIIPFGSLMPVRAIKPALTKAQIEAIIDTILRRNAREFYDAYISGMISGTPTAIKVDTPAGELRLSTQAIIDEAAYRQERSLQAPQARGLFDVRGLGRLPQGDLVAPIRSGHHSLVHAPFAARIAEARAGDVGCDATLISCGGEGLARSTGLGNIRVRLPAGSRDSSGV